MATDEAQEATPPAIVALAAQVDEMRARVQRMHVDLRSRSRTDSEYPAGVKGMGAATLELIDAQVRLRTMRVAHRQQRVADLLAQDLRHERLRLWQLTGGVALAGALIAVLAVSGAIPATRLAIGVPVLLAAVLMAVSMNSRITYDAGQRAINLRKAIAAAILAALALIGALIWRPLGYACLFAVVVAAIPLVTATRARRRRDATTGDGGGSSG
jgi:hypothetical protein